MIISSFSMMSNSVVNHLSVVPAEVILKSVLNRLSRMPLVGLILVLLFLMNGISHFSRLLFKELNQFKVILLILQTQQLVLLFILGIFDFCFNRLKLSNQVLETFIHMLHLVLLQSYALLKLDDTVVGLC